MQVTRTQTVERAKMGSKATAPTKNVSENPQHRNPSPTGREAEKKYMDEAMAQKSGPLTHNKGSGNQGKK